MKDYLFSHFDLAPVEEVLDMHVSYSLYKAPINPTVAFGQFWKCHDYQNTHFIFHIYYFLYLFSIFLFSIQFFHKLDFS